MKDLQTVMADLTAAGEEVDRMVADLDDGQWSLATPAPDWTVKHQIAHLAFIFHIAGMAAADPEQFEAMTASIGSSGFGPAVNAALAEYLDDPTDVLLTRWRAERDAAIEALSAVPADQMVPWLVNPLPPAVLASAGMMELFAHGQDIADALGEPRTRTDRIEHLVEFVTLTWNFGYQARNLTPPDTAFRFELTAPSGAVLAFGPEGAAQRITGDAADFCLLATRRRHRDDVDVSAEGADADQWLDVAQAYRGPAGDGRRPGQFAVHSS